MNEVHLRPKRGRRWDVVLYQGEFAPARLLDTVTGEDTARERGHEFAEMHRARLVIHPRETAAITSEHVLEDYTR